MDTKSDAVKVLRFASKFCQKLESSQSKSVVASPLSAQILLALLALGATNPAQAQLFSVLEFKNNETIKKTFKSLFTKLKAVTGITLYMANKIYLKEGDSELVPNLKEDSETIFDCSFEKINFSDTSNAAKIINQWVESKTNNRIKELIKKDCLNDATRMVMLNALFFKGSWKHQFDPQLTQPYPFHISSETTVEIPMMSQKRQFKYRVSKKLKCQLLELPYDGDGVTMSIVLPSKKDSVDVVLKLIGGNFDLIGELDQMAETEVEVILPKFITETEIDLKPILAEMGIKAIFDPTDSGLNNLLTTKEQLFVSEAVQKVYIEVNEEGVEAAAATGMVMMMRCAISPAPSFIADRPFLYMLTASNFTPLFMGVFRGPN